MTPEKPLRIGMICHPTVGGSGMVASRLGIELAKRGHEVHFISYERPFGLPENAPRIHFHQVEVNHYELFKYPDYTLPLSVKMAEVTKNERLEILHVHYAVPHATAALLARSMLAQDLRPRIVTTLHGTDATLLGKDPNYGPAISFALNQSDAVTTVSNFLKMESELVFQLERPIDVIHNFFEPGMPKLSKQQVREDLAIRNDELMILHISNLRRVKRIDLLLQTAAQIKPKDGFKLVIVAGARFTPYMEQLRQLHLEDRTVVLENVSQIEDYLQAADLALFSSESESFCLSILETMFFGCPSVATEVGGIPELVENGKTGLLVPFGDTAELSSAAAQLIHNKEERLQLGSAAKASARARFTADIIVPKYESVYRKVLETV